SGSVLIHATVFIIGPEQPVDIIGPERPSHPNQFPPGPCRAAIEVIQNSTQRTSLFVAPTVLDWSGPGDRPATSSTQVSPGADVAFTPQPDPPGIPTLGLTRGQTLRLNVANVASDPFPPDPCFALVRFLDETGSAIGKTHAVTVAGGQAAS